MSQAVSFIFFVGCNAKLMQTTLINKKEKEKNVSMIVRFLLLLIADYLTRADDVIFANRCRCKWVTG